MRLVSSLRTPAVIVQRPVVARNLARMAERAKARGLALTPHIKTHKNSGLARWQVELGAPGIMVSKLGEAAAMLAGGLTDQFIGYPLVGPQQEARLAALVAQGLRPRVAVDSEEGVVLVEQVSVRTGVAIPVMVEVDTGFHRCGLEDADAARRLAEFARARGVPVQGVTCFGGHIGHRSDPAEITRLIRAESEILERMRASLDGAGFTDLVVSEGGTVPAGYLDAVTAATEIRPGTYIFNDVAIVQAKAATWDDCAAQVLTEVVSTPAPTRAVVDAGSKTLAGDGPIDGSFGYIVERPDLKIERISEEHGVVVRRDGGPTGLKVGDRIHVVPNHVCTMINLHDEVVLADGDTVIGTLAVEARGTVR
jgi:D-serine deaminase-like pyridoxal phosphate-dependent protein